MSKGVHHVSVYPEIYWQAHVGTLSYSNRAFLSSNQAILTNLPKIHNPPRATGTTPLELGNHDVPGDINYWIIQLATARKGLANFCKVEPRRFRDLSESDTRATR